MSIPNTNVAAYTLENISLHKDLIAFVNEQYKDTKITLGEVYDHVSS